MDVGVSCGGTCVCVVGGLSAGNVRCDAGSRRTHARARTHTGKYAVGYSLVFVFWTTRDQMTQWSEVPRKQKQVKQHTGTPVTLRWHVKPEMEVWSCFVTAEIDKACRCVYRGQLYGVSELPFCAFVAHFDRLWNTDSHFTYLNKQKCPDRWCDYNPGINIAF
jgi:hypothetical protein